MIPGQAARRAGAAAARERRHARVPARGGHRHRSSRGRTARACTSSTPRTSRGCPPSTPSSTRSIARRCSRRSTASPRSASRDESRPVLTGILVRFEAGKLSWSPTDSYRLSVKETELAEAAPGARGDHPGPGARRSSHGLAGGGDTIAPRRPREPRRLRHRRRVADHAPDRRPVPELPPAAAGCFRGRADAAEAELADVVRRASVMALRNSPLRLRLAEGELTVSAQTQDVGETRSRCPRPTPARSS